MSSPSSPNQPSDADNIVVDKYDSAEEAGEKVEEENSDGAEEETNRFQPTFPIVQRSIPTTPKRSFLITDILSEDKSSSVEPCSAFRPLRIPSSLMGTDRFSSISAAQHCLNFSALKSHSENEKTGDHRADDDDDDIDEDDDEDDDDKSSGQWIYLSNEFSNLFILPNFKIVHFRDLY
jgi:hypothetical protein